MQDQDTATITFKEVIDFMEVGMSGSGKPFHFLAIKLKRSLKLEEVALFRELFAKHPHIGILPLKPPEIGLSEIHILADISGSTLKDQTNGTLTTVFRVSQMLESNFSIKGKLTMNEQLRPFNERMPSTL